MRVYIAHMYMHTTVQKLPSYIYNVAISWESIKRVKLKDKTLPMEAGTKLAKISSNTVFRQ